MINSPNATGVFLVDGSYPIYNLLEEPEKSGPVPVVTFAPFTLNDRATLEPPCVQSQ